MLARLFPPRHTYRRITLTLTAIFALAYITLIAISVPRCDGIHILPPPSSFGKKNCKVSGGLSARLVFGLASAFPFLPLIELVCSRPALSTTADLLSDLILVVWPLLMLYKVKLSRPKDRPLVVISLGCSIFTFLLIVVLVIFNFGPITKDNNYYTILGMLAHMTVSYQLHLLLGGVDVHYALRLRDIA